MSIRDHLGNIIAGSGGGGATADDTAYGASWDGNTDAPTKNVVYDKIETITSVKVFANYTSNAAQAISLNSAIRVNYGNKITDTHNAVSVGANWQFVAPRAGNYKLIAQGMTYPTNFVASSEIILRIYKNNIYYNPIAYNALDTAVFTALYAQGSAIVPLVNDDTIYIEMFVGKTATQTHSTAPEFNSVTILEM